MINILVPLFLLFTKYIATLMKTENTYIFIPLRSLLSTAQWTQFRNLTALLYLYLFHSGSYKKILQASIFSLHLKKKKKNYLFCFCQCNFSISFNGKVDVCKILYDFVCQTAYTWRDPGGGKKGSPLARQIGQIAFDLSQASIQGI